ncbi:MAG: FeoA family protein [Bacillota bacterium]|jgi:ferrous iron transport protein A
MKGNHDHEPKAATLSDLRLGQTGVIGSVNATGMVRNRLLDLGLLHGTRVTAVRRAPLGDPTAYKVRGATLALRHEDASVVAVTLEPVSDPEVEAEQC